MNIDKIMDGVTSNDETKFSLVSSNIKFFEKNILFEDLSPLHQKYWIIVHKYHVNTTGGVLNKDMFEVIIKKTAHKVDDKVELLKLYTVHCTTEVPSVDKFKFYVNYFRDECESQYLTKFQALAAVAMETEWTDPKTKIVYKGPAGAKAILNRAIHENPYNKFGRSAPRGNIATKEEMAEMAEDYDTASKGIVKRGLIFTGFHEIDSMTNGIQPGDLTLIGAFTGEGKSFLISNIGYHAAFEMGYNVLIITAETSRKVYRRRVVTRHSNNPKFMIQQGLQTTKIKTGTLSASEQAKYLKILEDIAINQSYGYLDIAQLNRGATIDDIALLAEEINDSIKLDLLMIDYVEMLSPRRPRASRREEIEELLIDSKELALTFDNGRSIPVISAHQIKEKARQRVEDYSEDNFYHIEDFSNTNEAGKSADHAIMLLRTSALKKQNELACKVVKNRDGDSSRLFKLYERYSTAFIGNL